MQAVTGESSEEKRQEGLTEPLALVQQFNSNTVYGAQSLLGKQKKQWENGSSRKLGQMLISK